MGDLHLSDADTFAVHLEHDPLLRSTIIAVAILDRAPDWRRLERTVERATRLEPNFRRRLEPGHPPLVPARFHDDPGFELSWHLRRIAVPSGGTVEDVLELARIAGTTAFDPIRPRWELTVVEGLPAGRAALVMKLHHALTDGIGGILLAHHLVDLDRRGTRRPPVDEPPAAADGDGIERIADAIAHDARRAATSVRQVAAALPRAGVAVAAHPWRAWQEVRRTLGSLYRFVQPVTSTMSPVMTARRPDWRYRVFDVSLADLRRASSMADGTLNDAFLAAVAGGLARYHDRHGECVEALRVTMPISTRRPDDGPGGNHITLVRFPIPVGEHDPLSRMLAIDHTARRWREEPAVGWAEGIAGALNLLPASVAAGMLKHVDVVASNLPGFDAPVFVSGAKVEHFYALGPTLGAAANVILMSYDGRCCIGVTTDAGAVPDADVFSSCIRAGFDELIEVARGWGP
jgi:WS/DGAT/MGAT family acyltransferase